MDKLAHQLSVAIRPIASLRPHPRNPRTHSREQIRQIANSIRAFGFTIPVLIDEEGKIIAGHGRVEAIKQLGGKEVPTICLAELTEAQKHAYILADNKLAERAGWDPDLIALELAYISKVDVDFDLTLTGFEASAIDFLLGATNTTGPAEEAPLTIDPTKPAVTRLDDLWLLGRHRLLCGDARKADSFRHLLEDERAQMIFIDPPCGVPINGSPGGQESIVQRDFIMASAEKRERETIAFLTTVFAHTTMYSIHGSMHFVFLDLRDLFELLSAARGSSFELKGLCVQNKNKAAMGSFYDSDCEIILVFKHASAPHEDRRAHRRSGRKPGTLWDYARVNTLRAGQREEPAMRPTIKAKPVALVADAILDCTKRGAVVLDCFGGSGTTLIAAEQTARRAYVMELDPAYVDVTIRRFQKLTGEHAIHAETQRSFRDTERERSSGAGSRANAEPDEEGKNNA